MAPHVSRTARHAAMGAFATTLGECAFALLASRDPTVTLRAAKIAWEPSVNGRALPPGNLQVRGMAAPSTSSVSQTPWAVPALRGSRAPTAHKVVWRITTAPTASRNAGAPRPATATQSLVTASRGVHLAGEVIPARFTLVNRQKPPSRPSRRSQHASLAGLGKTARGCATVRTTRPAIRALGCAPLLARTVTPGLRVQCACPVGLATTAAFPVTAGTGTRTADLTDTATTGAPLAGRESTVRKSALKTPLDLTVPTPATVRPTAPLLATRSRGPAARASQDTGVPPVRKSAAQAPMEPTAP
uniref:Uncharacterized protein n=1 Tax=Ixodes ricinus TaxID=34613 RepID=A0A147BBD4_IXORI